MATGLRIFRKDYLIKLAEELVGMIDETFENDICSRESSSKKRKTCSFKKCRNKSRELCDECKKVICGNHSETTKRIVCVCCKNTN